MRSARVEAAYQACARVTPTLALLALLLLGGWLAARWVVYLAAPAETPASPPRERVQLGAAAQTLADSHLFGAAATAGGQAVSNLNVKLKGVFAGGATGVAILNAGGRDEATPVGGEVVPGVTLESVHPQYVVLRRAGALERVNLDERMAPPPSRAALPRAARVSPLPTPVRAPAPVAVAPPAPSNAPAPPLQGGPGAQFQRPEPYAPVGDVATEPPPAAQPALPSPQAAMSGSPQGVVIQTVPPGSVLASLGLQPGDIVRTVNGERVTSEADVARILQQRGIQGSFSAEVQRGAVTIPLAVSGAR